MRALLYIELVAEWFSVCPITEDKDCYDVLKQLNPPKPTGPCKVPPWAFLDGQQLLFPRLTFFLNESIKDCVFPSMVKVSSNEVERLKSNLNSITSVEVPSSTDLCRSTCVDVIANVKWSNNVLAVGYAPFPLVPRGPLGPLMFPSC